MQSQAQTPEEYINQIPDIWKDAFIQIRNTITTNLPKGFHEEMSYGMVGYVIPHETYPKGYHCNPKLPLPFINIAAQKNFIALYHMGLYANKTLYDWFLNEYNTLDLKPDMGKSCIRFKKTNQIPFQLIGELCKKITPVVWIQLYESSFK